MTGKAAQEGASLELGPTSTKIDFAQGTLMVTGNTFDLAIEGEGFFTIRTPQGPAYTRNGSFMLNSRKELVTASGDLVMGETGPSVVEGDNVQIGADCTIYADENPIGKIRITTFADPHRLTRSAQGRFTDTTQSGTQNASDFRIAGGYLEMSNVNAVKEMVNMMEIQRAFETYQKIILTITDMDKISTGRIGKLI